MKIITLTSAWDEERLYYINIDHIVHITTIVLANGKDGSRINLVNTVSETGGIEVCETVREILETI